MLYYNYTALYCILSYRSIFHHFVLCYITLRAAMLCSVLLYFEWHDMPFYVMVYDNMSCYVVSCVDVLCYAIVCYAMIGHDMRCDPVSVYFMLCPVMSSPAVWCGAMPCYVTSRYDVLRHVTVLYAALRCVRYIM